MIEKNVAYENLDEIVDKANALGVDMTQWGPADFGFSRGNPKMGSTNSIRPFEETVIKKSLEYGIPPSNRDRIDRTSCPLYRPWCETLLYRLG